MKGLSGPNHTPANSILSRSEYGNSLIARNSGHKEYLEDLKIGTPSVWYIKEMFL